MFERTGILTLALALSPLAGASEGWMIDFETAKKRAAKEGKDLLIDFTGSDWCGWCIRLDREVFSQEAFRKEAPKHFVLVELDFPRGKRLEPKTQEQNERLQAEFGVRGFPTILLADAQGRPYARTGYLPGGAGTYLEHLAEKRSQKTARDAAFAEAEKTRNQLDKARLLDQALRRLEQDGLLIGYDGVMAEIVRLDAENEAGLKEKYEEHLTFQKIERTIRAEKYDEAVRLADAYLTGKASPEAKQKVSFLKAQAQFAKEDYANTVATLEATQKLAPETALGRQIPRIIATVKARMEK